MIKDINNEFNNILNKTFWEEKEYNLYNTLRLVINKYEKHAKYYLLNKKDKPNIINNYIENNNECFFKRPVMNNVLNSLYIIEYISELNNKINFLLVKIRFNDLEYFGFAKMLESQDFIKVDTLNVANVKWKSSLNDSIVGVKEGELLLWLKQELKTEKIRVKRD